MKAKILNVEKLDNYNQEGVIQIGKKIVEALDKKGVLKEKLGVSKEDLQLDGNTILYTSAVAGFIEQRLRPKLVAKNVIKAITLDLKGHNSIKLPLRSALITASELGDDGAISYDSGTYGGQTVTVTWVYAANKITYEMLSQSNVDLMANELGEIGDAIARKMDSDIITAIAGACTTGNSNYYAGGTAEFTDITTAYANALNNYAEPDVLLCDPNGYKKILDLSQTMTALEYKPTVMPNPLTYLGLKIVISPQVPDNKLFLIDTARTGYLVKGSNVQTWDGRISSTLAFEVIGAMNYGVGIVQPTSIYELDWS